MSLYKIAIVGLGPKGLYAFERLMARLHDANETMEIEIHLFEKTGIFGAGEIYDSGQPEYLIMNYPNRNINVWPNEKPSPPVPETLSFVAWLREYENNNEEKLDNGFSPRGLVGKYLNYCFELLLVYKRDSIQVFNHPMEVRDIQNSGTELVLSCIIDNGKFSRQLTVNEVLLTTGHSSGKGKLDFSGNSSNQDKSDFIPFVYPVEDKLGHIGDNAMVGIKGLGLTFIDTVLALTEGRGGQFQKMDNGNTIYIPSGHEPNTIFAFSRSGLPMIPRSGTEGLKPYEPFYFTNENILQRSGIQSKVRFLEHILPLLIAEIQYRYYGIIFDRYNLSFYPDKDLSGLNGQINAFHEKYPEVYRLDFTDLFKSKTFGNPSLELGTLAYLRYLLQEAEIGSGSSAFMAAAMTWGHLSETFNHIYSFGGMTTDSHDIFDCDYRSKLNRISYGPPLENMKKIMALVETGIVDLECAENPEVKKINGGWSICSSRSNFQKFDILIDARIPVIGSMKDWSPLLKNMGKSGLLRPYKIHNGSSYDVGCPEIDSEGRAIDRNNVSMPNVSFYGTPTEGITYDNDTLSRTRNNFASQWAINVLENYRVRRKQAIKENSQNG